MIKIIRNIEVKSKKGGKNLNLKIEQLKDELAQAVNNPNTTMEDLEKISYNIDEEIEKSYFTKNANTEDNYSKYIDREDKEETIAKIKSNLLDIYYNITSLELEMLSQNIYDYCCLMVHQIPKQDIVKYILNKNAKYYDALSEKEQNRMKISPNIKIFEGLIKKYTKILKSNKES